MDLLAGSDSDSKDNADDNFKINKKYAKSYQIWRRKEEKQKLIDKYGEDFDSSSSEEEEEIRTSKGLDKEWLRAYSVVRFNQPRLHSGERLFQEELMPVAKKGDKKVTLKDHERKFILEKGGVASEDENEDLGSKNIGKSYMEEQLEIKNSIMKAIGDSESEEEEKDDSLLVKKSKTKEEETQEENDYLAWLKGEKEELTDTKAAEELAPLKAYWSNPNLTDKEKVLRDYILNNGYMDKENSDDDDNDSESDDGAFDFGQEEEFLDEADKHEKTYNFRHEEPGGIEIKSYPRVIETSVRAKETNRRAEKRKLKNDKKQKEKEQRLEEIKILRNLQKEEKEEKLRKLKEAAEIPDLEYNLDDDFDPEEHNRIMQKYFDDGYYQEGDASEKPVFEPDGDEAFGDEAETWWQSRSEDQMDFEQNTGNYEGVDDEELYADDPGFVMDVDYDPKNVEKVKQSKKEAKRNKKKAKLEKLPLFDPTKKTFDEYLDEYLKNKINTLPFTYREVMPNNYGLSTEEILVAPDRELNSWVSVKKMSMYRADQDENHDLHKYNAKSRNVMKKYKVLPSLAPQQNEESSGKKKKKKKKKSKEQEDGSAEADAVSSSVDESRPLEKAEDNCDQSDKKKSKKRKLISEDEQNTESVDANTHSSDISAPLKKKMKQTENQNENSAKTKSSVEKHNLVAFKERKGSKKDKKKAKDKKKKSSKNDSSIVDSEKSQEPAEGKMSSVISDEKHTSEEGAEVSKKKKNKKRKSKLQMNNAESVEPVVIDKQKAKENLRKVMSVSRLSSYGLVPGKNKNANKLAKKKKKTANTDTKNH